MAVVGNRTQQSRGNNLVTNYTSGSGDFTPGSGTQTDPALTYHNDASGQPNGTALTIANSGGLSGDSFPTVNVPGTGTVNYSNNWVLGNWACYAVTGLTSDTAYTGWTGLGSALSGAFSVYFRTGTASTGLGERLIDLRNASATQLKLNWGSTGQLVIQDSLGGTFWTATKALKLNTEYRFDLAFTIDTSGGAGGLINFDYYEGNDTTPVEAGCATVVSHNGTSGITEVRFGMCASSTFTGTTFWAQPRMRINSPAGVYFEPMPANSSSASLAATAATTATGVVGVSSDATVPITSATTASGVIGTNSGSSLANTASITATGNLATAAGASLAVTAAPTATGSLVSFRAGANNKANSTAPSVVVPAGCQVGDVVLISLSQNNTNVITATPGGLTTQDTNTVTATFPNILYTGVVGTGGITAGGTLSWTLSATRQWSVDLYAVTGLNTLVPILGSIPTPTANATAATTVNTPSLTTTLPGWIMEIVSGKSNGTAITSWTAPSGWTIQQTVAAPGTFSGCAAIADNNSGPRPPGTYGSDTYTASAQFAGVVAYTLALNPAGPALTSTATISATGNVGTSSGASLASTATTSAAGLLAMSSGASLPVTASLTSTGSVLYTRDTSPVAVTSSITAAGNVATSTSATLSPTASLTATGAVARSGDASLAVTSSTATVGTATGSPTVATTAALSATGNLATASGATLTATAARTAAGNVATSSGASDSITASITAAGVIGTSQGASLAVTAATTAAGLAAYSQSATLAVTATTSATGSKGSATTASLAATAAITSAGTVTSGLSSGSSLATTAATTASGNIAGAQAAALTNTASISAAGVVGKSSSATIAVVVSPSAAGLVNRIGSVAQAITAAISASGVVGRSSGASQSIVVSLVASGTVGMASSATLPITAQIAATGTVTATTGRTVKVWIGNGWVSAAQQSWNGQSWVASG